MEGLTRMIIAHPWPAILACVMLFLAAGFAAKKIKVLAIILAAAGIIAFYFIFKSGALTGMKPGNINDFKEKTKQKVVESIKKEFRR